MTLEVKNHPRVPYPIEVGLTLEEAQRLQHELFQAFIDVSTGPAPEAASGKAAARPD